MNKELQDQVNRIHNMPVAKKQQNKAIDEAMKTKRTYKEILCMVYQLGHRDGRYSAIEVLTEDEICHGKAVK